MDIQRVMESNDCDHAREFFSSFFLSFPIVPYKLHRMRIYNIIKNNLCLIVSSLKIQIRWKI